MKGAVEFLRHLELLYKAFSIHLKHQKAQKLSLDEAISKLETLDNFSKETVENVMSTFEKPCKPSGIMGTVSSQTLSFVRMILEGLRALEQLLKELSPNYKIDLYTCLSIQVENLHAMGHFEGQFPTLLQYAQNLAKYRVWEHKKSFAVAYVLLHSWEILFSCSFSGNTTLTCVFTAGVISTSLDAQLRWPKRVNHKSVYQNTKQFPKTQINFPKHKLVSQNTNRFLKTQINLSKQEPVCQNTNQFLETQTNFAKHKSMDWALALKLSERAWKGLIYRIFRVQHGDIFMRVTTHQAFSDKMFFSHCGSEVKCLLK